MNELTYADSDTCPSRLKEYAITLLLLLFSAVHNLLQMKKL